MIISCSSDIHSFFGFRLVFGDTQNIQDAYAPRMLEAVEYGICKPVLIHVSFIRDFLYIIWGTMGKREGTTLSQDLSLSI